VSAHSAGLTALRHDALRDAGVCAMLLGAVAAAITPLLGLSLGYVAKALLCFAVCYVFVHRNLRHHLPHGVFGAANRVTLGRLAMVTMLAAGLGELLTTPWALAWGIVVLATVAAVLDAVDGPLARRSGLSSEFGARFDMETDALLMLVLSLLILYLGKAGAWVLAAGLLRYAFVLATWVWPWMARPLPPSTRRKTICVVQIVALIVCLGPIISVWWATAIAAAGLALLVYSFAVDLAWLVRARHLHGESKP
jgi:phosphatidylglycerophosphate synthase